MTKSGGISLSKNLGVRWHVSKFNSGVEIILKLNGYSRLQLRTKAYIDSDKDREIYGHQAFMRFKKILLDDGIDLNEYIIDNGREVKNLIPKNLKLMWLVRGELLSSNNKNGDDSRRVLSNMLLFKDANSNNLIKIDRLDE